MQKIINETKLDFDDVLIRPKRSTLNSRSEVCLTRKFTFKYSSRELLCVPIMAANMDTVGTFDMAKTLCYNQAITCLHKHYNIDQYVSFYTSNDTVNKNLAFYSIGTSQKDIEKLIDVFNKIRQLNAPVPNVCIDVANGYTEQFVKTVSHIRKLYDDIVIMAGNVVTPEMVEELIIHGKADIVKVGIGSGSVCTTRLKTGVGYPQLSAVMECTDAAHGLSGHICSDGGCKIVGDVCKAFGANTDFVMLGSMFAGADECEGEWIYELSKKISLKFYGMSSTDAMNKHHNGVAKYRTDEGKSVIIPYKGKVEDIIQDIYGGLRSACTYVGASKIKDFGKKTTFIQVNNTHNKIYEKH
jgi:GMP reductase